jgi:hypothetical protein
MSSSGGHQIRITYPLLAALAAQDVSKARVLKSKWKSFSNKQIQQVCLLLQHASVAARLVSLAKIITIRGTSHPKLSRELSSPHNSSNPRGVWLFGDLTD